MQKKSNKKNPFSFLLLSLMAYFTPCNAMDPNNPTQLFDAKENPIYAYMKTAYGYNFDSWGTLQFPKATNAWFTNLSIIPLVSCSEEMIKAGNSLCKKISPQPSEQCFAQAWCPQRFIPNNSGTMNEVNGVTIAPVMETPFYVGKTSIGGLKVSYAGSPSGLSKEKEGPKAGKVFAVLWDPPTDVHLSALEFFDKSAQPSYFLTEQTPLSTTLTMTANTQKESPQKIDAPLVRGSAYITLMYQGLTPVITMDGSGLMSVNGLAPVLDIPPSNKFKVVDSLNKTWILYFKEQVKLKWRNTGLGNNALVLDKPYTGWMRLAFLSDSDNTNDEAVLDKYSSIIPTGGTVSYQVSGNEVNYQLNWQTTTNEAPLILQMPHHNQMAITGIKMNSNSGPLTGVVAKSWSIKEILPKLDFTLFTSKNEIPTAQVTEILAALEKDIAQIDNPNFFNPDAGPYTFGKHSAKLANLALIAKVLQQEELKSKVVSKLEQELSKWISGQNKEPLFYDTTFGGIVPTSDDFGALSVYNDHHFHYGYFVYTFAVLAKLDPQWLSTSVGSRNTLAWVKTLIKDYANPTQDNYFPRLRMQDDYDGHSWASGMVVYGDGKNQESSSEAVNSYFAIALLGDAINDGELSDLGRFLLAREIKAAQTYWQLTPNNTLYPESYAYYVVANIFNAKIDAHTFFEKDYYIGYTTYGIEMLPFTAISPRLIGDWVNSNLNPLAYQDLVDVMNYNSAPYSTPSQWKWVLYKGVFLGSPINKQKELWSQAVQTATTFADFDDGDTRTNTLFNLSAYLNGKGRI